jgi:hypothetical protein
MRISGVKDKDKKIIDFNIMPVYRIMQYSSTKRFSIEKGNVILMRFPLKTPNYIYASLKTPYFK